MKVMHKVVKKGNANFWRGRVRSYSGAVLECGHTVMAFPSAGDLHPVRVKCIECMKLAREELARGGSK